MEMREWLSIIVIVAIVLIVLDGFRRKRKERNPVRMKLERNLPPALENEEDETLAELPGGGARTIPRDQYKTSKPNREKAANGKHGRKSKMEEKVRFEEKVPVLMETVNIAPEDVEAKEARETEEVPLYADTGEPVAMLEQEEIRAGRRGRDDDDGYDDEEEEDDYEDEDDDLDEEEDDDYDDEDEFADDEEDEYSGNFDGNDEYDEEYEDDDLDEDEDEDDDYDDEEDDEDFDEDFDEEEEDEYSLRGNGMGGRVEPTFAADDFDDELAAQTAAEAVAAALPRVERSQLTRDLQGELPLGPEDYDSGEIAETDEELGAAEEVIVINVMARKGEVFHGKELLPVLLSQGMRLGDMSIFHRHADSSGNGPVIFSMANMVKPGTFDLGEMDSFSTPGVSFFQQLPGPLNNMKNFERMLGTATTLRDALGGELKDENRSVLTRQTVEHYRQRIRDFELRRELSRKQIH